jgi:SAM-dependent methyltransferase
MNASHQLAAEYSVKADAYARWWSPVIRPMALPLVDALPLATSRAVLDVGCGTGALLRDLRRAAPNAAIVGVDSAEGMLREADPPPGSFLAVTDVQDLAVRSSSIDVAVLAFVLFHVADPERGLREVRRALSPGGAVGLATWGRDQGTPGLTIWAEELDRAGARPDPRDPSVMQQGRMDTIDKVRGLLQDAGFEPVRIWTHAARHAFRHDELFAVQAGCGLPARRLATLDQDARAVCEARVWERLRALGDAELVYEPEVVLTVGRRVD